MFLMDERTIDRWMDEWTIDRWMDERTIDRWMDEPTNRQMDAERISYTCISKTIS